VQIPLRMRDVDGFRAQLRSLVETAGCHVVLGAPGYLDAIPEGLALAWEVSGDRAHEVETGADDVAVIQFTSGSTAAPRGAVLTQRAVLAQLYGLRASDPPLQGAVRVASWTPFFHDLGLFLALVAPVVYRGSSRILPTERFARDPLEWFRLVERGRSTVTVGPSSAWAVTLRRALRSGERFDLSSLEHACFGAEGVAPETVDALLAQTERFGLDPRALANTYGLAEVVLCVSGNRPPEGLRFDAVDADAFRLGRAEPASGPLARRILSCGRPSSHLEVRIVRAGETQPEREIGEIQVRGASLMSGYIGPEAPQAIVDGWLHTGDLGYLADEELYVTGRIKDVLVVMGHNHHPEDLEWVAGRVEGVKAGRCVAFDAGTPEEPRVVVLVEPSASADPAGLALAVRDAVADAIGLTPAEVAVVPRGTIALTTSGKLRRGTMREAYVDGKLGEVAGALAGR
jgi:fatty-acyl-CoA synthase